MKKKNLEITGCWKDAGTSQTRVSTYFLAVKLSFFSHKKNLQGTTACNHGVLPLQEGLEGRLQVRGGGAGGGQPPRLPASPDALLGGTLRLHGNQNPV